MKQPDTILEHAERCAHLAETPVNRPTFRRFKRVEEAWRALAYEQDWLDGEIPPGQVRNENPLSVTHA